MDEELCQRRALKMVAGAYSSVPLVDDKSNDYGAEVAVGTIEGDVSVDLVISGNSDPPTC